MFSHFNLDLTCHNNVVYSYTVFSLSKLALPYNMRLLLLLLSAVALSSASSVTELTDANFDSSLEDMDTALVSKRCIDCGSRKNSVVIGHNKEASKAKGFFTA